MTDDDKAAEILARAYDAEDSAQRGEPTPWRDDIGGGDDEWINERRHCGQAALAALRAAGYRLAGPEEAVVPRVATEDMATAGTEAWLCESAMEDRANVCWTAMVAAGERKG